MSIKIHGFVAALVIFAGCSSDGTPSSEDDSASGSKATVAGNWVPEDENTGDEKPGNETTEAADAEVAQANAADPADASVPGGEESTMPLDEPESPETEKDRLIAEVELAFKNQEVDRGIGLLEQAYQADPQDQMLALSLVHMWIQRGMQLAQEDPEQSHAKLLAAAKLMRELRDAGGELPEHGNQLLAIALFKEGGVHAASGKVPEALASLREAVDAGFLNPSALESDEDLASLRGNAEFDQLVAEVRETLMARLRAGARAELDGHEPFPFSFQLPNLQDEVVSSADFKGKILIVDLWGTWCPPCRAEVPHFIKLQENYADHLQMVGINYEQAPRDQWKEIISGFVAQQGVTYPCLIGDDDTAAQVPDFQAFPTTLFIDAEGTVRLKVVGGRPYEQLEAIVLELMADAAASES